MSDRRSSLARLFNPQSIAVIGGGRWGEAVIKQARDFGFPGEIFAIHPSKSEIAGIATHIGANALPVSPDAAFIGINREATVGATERLRKKGAGGAVCFASGFLEASAEDATGANAQERLLRAAGDMPILGPNCYGFINALDRVAIWPDQHGCVTVERGVAILTQSSNIAINLTMQRRGLPIAFVVACGNQAQTSLPDIASELLEDPRITAIGCHIEGFSDLPEWEQFAKSAQERNIPVAAIKVGATHQARAATLSHTASIAGSEAGSTALLQRLGFHQVPDLESFVEILKLFHLHGPLPNARIGSISCSGGEASLVADLAVGHGLELPLLTASQRKRLRKTLGPRVALANPLDYHTYIWRDHEEMAQTWIAAADGDQEITLIIADFPRDDRCDPSDWDCAITAAIKTAQASSKPVALVSTLTELLPEEIAQRLIDGGVIPFSGLRTALKVLSCAVTRPVEDAGPVLLTEIEAKPVLFREDEAKTLLHQHGLATPAGATSDRSDTLAQLSQKLSFPVVVKRLGEAHKSDTGGVALGLWGGEAVESAATQMGQGPFLVEEMAPAGLELLVGISRDPVHGLLLTLGPGGITAELSDDHQHLLLPTTAQEVKQALNRLRIAPLMNGYRSIPPIDLDATVAQIMALHDFVVAHAARIDEVEINPLICTGSGAVAVDVLLRMAP